MTIYERIRVEKMQYDVNREATKIFELSFCKIEKYEYYARHE